MKDKREGREGEEEKRKGDTLYYSGANLVEVKVYHVMYIDIHDSNIM